MHICLSGLLLAWLFYMFGSGFGQYGMMLNVKCRSTLVHTFAHLTLLRPALSAH